jgi:hypothetical protein
MAEIKIRVGAAADASLRTVFKPLIQAAQEARKAIMTELGAIPRQLNQSFQQGSKGAATALRGLETSARLTGQSVSNSSRQAAGDMAREFSKSARAAEREIRKEHAAIERGAPGRRPVRSRQRLERLPASKWRSTAR